MKRPQSRAGTTAPEAHLDPQNGDNRDGAPDDTPDFLRIYDEHVDFLWRSAAGLGVPADAREDIVQEVMLVVHRRLDQFEWRSSVKTWLFGILYNVVANYRRSVRRKGITVEIPETARSEGDPQSAAIDREDLRFVQAFLESLADEPRGVFVAFFLERMSAPETAEATGLSIESVYSSVRTLKRRFRAALTRREEQPG